MSAPAPTPTTPMHLGLYLLGGICLGAGLLNLYWSFGREDGTFNSDFTQVGFTALDDISLLAAADFSIPLLVVGVCCMIIANSTAWKETGGY